MGNITIKEFDTEYFDPRERIINSAVQLFSHKGYSAVGVREIASMADVNIAMISYYYGGKIGILKEIIQEYFTDLERITKKVLENCTSPDDCLRTFIRKMIKLMQLKPDLCRVAIIEMPFDMSEISEFKLGLMHNHMMRIKENFHKNMPAADNPAHHVIIGPAFISMIYSNFLFGEIARKDTTVVFDEDFYDYYAEIITTIFLRGVIGLADMGRNKAGGHPGGHPASIHKDHPGGHPASIHKEHPGGHQ